jgi:ankyrin repeat protein
MLAGHPALLDAAYEWQPGDTETAIQAAAHVGAVDVAEFLLAQGAPLAICTAAMLGRSADVQRLLSEDPRRIQASGAHAIPLLTHASLSGDLALVQLLFGAGARDGASSALFNAVSAGDEAMARWLLENSGPDLAWRSYQGQTALEAAHAHGHPAIAALLESHGTQK